MTTTTTTTTRTTTTTAATTATNDDEHDDDANDDHTSAHASASEVRTIAVPTTNNPSLSLSLFLSSTLPLSFSLGNFRESPPFPVWRAIETEVLASSADHTRRSIPPPSSEFTMLEFDPRKRRRRRRGGGGGRRKKRKGRRFERVRQRTRYDDSRVKHRAIIVAWQAKLNA